MLWIMLPIAAVGRQLTWPVEVVSIDVGVLVPVIYVLVVVVDVDVATAAPAATPAPASAPGCPQGKSGAGWRTMPSEQKLSDVLSEFARTMVTDFPIQGILDHLVERIVDVLPITAAGVTLISPGTDPRYVAASDESALRFEELQTDPIHGHTRHGSLS